ncbi:MAG TPA: IpaB/EvcA family protein [Candidatus Ligilactobacillus excrementigallinarum]|uniref:IpaB/EvcA family protein n=1 Tax=Candidatus Ligilactobacillus excrementigallinarum TaxID=2838641 RepID=A0A9D1UXS8_9LACO|nr:IpaB/EvcA family protein [Candidatus Ligilactobacillus excrementigallinarum]
MTEPKLNNTVQALLKKAEEIQPNGIEIQYHDNQSGFVRHDQAQHYLRNGKLIIDVLDQTNVNYVVAHELLHFMLMFEKLPQISFNLESERKDLDKKYIATGMELYDILMHFFVYDQQRQLGLIDDQVEELYFKGILAVLKPEPKEGKDDWMVLRTVNVLDALVFFKENQEEVLPKLRELYPKATAQAEKLFALITAKPLDSAFNVRRAIVKLYKGFDQALESYGLYGMNLSTYVSLTPVLSARQLRLDVRQIFEIFHTDLKENLQFRTAYVGRMKNDQQNAFVIPEPKGNDQQRVQEFRRIYEMPVGKYLDSIGVPYLTR